MKRRIWSEWLKEIHPALTIAGSQGHINTYWTRHTLFLTDEHTQSFMCNGQINEHMSCEQWHNFFSHKLHTFVFRSVIINWYIIDTYAIVLIVAGRITCAIWLSRSALSPKEIFEKAYATPVIIKLEKYIWTIAFGGYLYQMLLCHLYPCIRVSQEQYCYKIGLHRHRQHDDSDAFHVNGAGIVRSISSTCHQSVHQIRHLKKWYNEWC